MGYELLRLVLPTTRRNGWSLPAFLQANGSRLYMFKPSDYYPVRIDYNQRSQSE